MNAQEIIDTSVKPGSVKKWLHVTIAAAVISSMLFFGFVAPASAGGATQISGIGYFDDGGECADVEGLGADFALILTGDLEGCQYIFVETFECSPSGTYRETGIETYVIDGPFGQGTFSTTYFLRAKYEGCSPDGGFVGAEIFGFCQHPIVASSGTGDYEGVTGRLHFKDDIAAGNYPYTGHLKW